MKNYILISLVLATLWSCNKPLDFNDEDYANQLILNSIICPDSAFTADLMKSTSILENTYGLPPTADGILDLFENGILLKHLTSTKGHFRATDIKPTTGNNYRVVVNSNGKQIEAETTIPAKAVVISIDTMTIKNEYGWKTIHYKIKIKDIDGDDFFRIVVTNDHLIQTISPMNNKNIKYYLTNILCPINSDDPVFESVYNNLGGDVLDMGPENSYYIFPDDYFKGKEYLVQFEASTINNFYGYDGTKLIYDRNIVHVQRLSKDLYSYMKYLRLYENYHDNPFAEPVPVYSNVKNGTGIFAGFNEDALFTFEKIDIPFSMDTITIEKNPSNGTY